MHPPGASTVLVRHGEIGVKSPPVQQSMERQLAENLRAVLADRRIDGTVEREHSRLYVHTADAAVEAACDAATAVFGVVSASPATQVDPSLDAICAALTSAAREQYEGGTFAVDATRAGEPDTHSFTSGDIGEEGGAAVWAAAEEKGIDPAVDLDDPDVTFFVEARPDRALVFLENRDGPGGLPLGTQQPLVALVSGGIDSPVAAWLAMKRGSPVVPLYVDLGDYGGPDHRLRAEATVARLRTYAPNHAFPLRVAPGGDGIQRLVETMDRFRMLSFRRFMFAIADHVAETVDAAGIVTGEAIGQKSSQTAANLRVTSAAADLPIHRPLLTADKTDITRWAREVGTFDDATINAGCNRIAPERPATAADREQVAAAEPADLFELAEDAADCVRVVKGDALATPPEVS